MFYLLLITKGSVPIRDPRVLDSMSESSKDLPTDNIFCKNSFIKPIEMVSNNAVTTGRETLCFRDNIIPKVITEYQIKWIKISELLGSIDGISLAGMLLATMTAKVHTTVKNK